MQSLNFLNILNQTPKSNCNGPQHTTISKQKGKTTKAKVEYTQAFVHTKNSLTSLQSSILFKVCSNLDVHLQQKNEWCVSIASQNTNYILK